MGRQHARPRHGPYATVTWDGAAGRWVRRLTDEGRALAGAYLHRYPLPALVLWRKWPGMARHVFGAYDADEVHQWARVGVSTAAALYDPGPDPAAPRATFKTYAVAAIRTAVHHGILLRRAGSPARFVRPDSDPAFCPADGQPWERLLGPDRPPDMSWLDGGWDAVLAVLPARDRRVVVMRAVEGRSLREIGEALGVSWNRAEQLWVRAAARLRESRPDLVAGPLPRLARPHVIRVH